MSERYFGCGHCLDTQLVLNEDGQARVCDRRGHLPMSDSALAVWRAVRRMQGPRQLNPVTVLVAQKLTLYTSSEPCPASAFGDLSLRQVAHHIEDLRSVWHLPVGSRKDASPGYWIITDLEDCKEWLRRATAAPKTQLATIWKAARAAFPDLANQQEFEFMNGIEADIAEAANVAL